MSLCQRLLCTATSAPDGLSSSRTFAALTQRKQASVKDLGGLRCSARPPDRARVFGRRASTESEPARDDT